MKIYMRRAASAMLSLWLILSALAACGSFQKETPADAPETAATLEHLKEDVLMKATDCIHFLNTGNSDAILLESDGHFAMVDAGEDTDNPRGFPELELEGFEQKVLTYLKSHAADAQGKVHLDFVLGTHAHSDHLGGFDTILADPDVTVDRAYLKKYDSSRINDAENTEWDNQEVYDQTIAALRARNIPVISEMNGTPFQLGNFKITLLNTDDPAVEEKVGENDQSVGMLIEKNGTRIFLGADLEDATGDLTRLAPQIGKVDLFKLCHHGIDGNNPAFLIEALMPRICVLTSYDAQHNQESRARIKDICDAQTYLTGVEDGVLAVIGDKGEIEVFGHIHNDT